MNAYTYFPQLVATVDPITLHLIMNTRLLKKLILVCLCGMGLYTAMYISAVNSDPYLAAERMLKSSEKLVIRMGEIKEIRLPVFGHFRQKWVGSTSSAKFKVEVKGGRETVLISLKMQKEDEIWRIQWAKIDGQEVSL